MHSAATRVRSDVVVLGWRALRESRYVRRFERAVRWCCRRRHKARSRPMRAASLPRARPSRRITAWSSSGGRTSVASVRAGSRATRGAPPPLRVHFRPTHTAAFRLAAMFAKCRRGRGRERPRTQGFISYRAPTAPYTSPTRPRGLPLMWRECVRTHTSPTLQRFNAAMIALTHKMCFFSRMCSLLLPTRSFLPKKSVSHLRNASSMLFPHIGMRREYWATDFRTLFSTRVQVRTF